MKFLVFILFLVAAGEAAGLMLFMFGAVAKRRHDLRRMVNSLREQLEDKQKLVDTINSIFSDMVDLGQLKTKGRELKLSRETLKTERGRLTITQAELETVEGRLRELEEIDRELEASGLETKEELNILKKKEKELSQKNAQLKEQIQLSGEQIVQLIGQLKMSTEMQAQVQGMQAELIETQQHIDSLLIQIEQGNEQYFVMKRRYDALDIEYAQLFEKFSEAEAMAGKSVKE